MHEIRETSRSCNSSVHLDGAHQANGPQIDRWQSSAQAAGHQGGAQERAGHWRRQETAPIPSWHSSPPGNSSLPEVDLIAHPQIAFPAV